MISMFPVSKEVLRGSGGTQDVFWNIALSTYVSMDLSRRSRTLVVGFGPGICKGRWCLPPKCGIPRSPCGVPRTYLYIFFSKDIFQGVQKAVAGWSFRTNCTSGGKRAKTNQIQNRKSTTTEVPSSTPGGKKSFQGFFVASYPLRRLAGELFANFLFINFFNLFKLNRGNLELAVVVKRARGSSPSRQGPAGLTDVGSL